MKSLDLLAERKGLLAAFDTMRREIDSSGQAAGMDRFQAKALDIITSRQAREAFDLTREPKKTIERYGKGKYTHQADKNILYDWDARPFVLPADWSRRASASSRSGSEVGTTTAARRRISSRRIVTVCPRSTGASTRW